MNLVAHYYLDRDRVNSHFVVGVATPDLLSIYNSNLRIKARHLKKMSEDQAGMITPPFLSGLYRHFFADGIFHLSPTFERQTKRISNMLKSYFPELNIQRKFFIAHILLELLIDKILIDDNPGILNSYYGHFGALQPFRDLRKTSEIALGRNLPNYESYMQKFLRLQYLYNYAKFDHISRVLQKILQRVGIDNNKYMQSGTFYQLMIDYEQELIPVKEAFFDEIRSSTPD